MRDGNTNAKLRIFLSYSVKDKEKAGKIQRRLESFGIEVFVSHDDIETEEGWGEFVMKNIAECECFVPLISENYHGASHTEQEFGMAIALKKKTSVVTCDRTKPVGLGDVYPCPQIDPETNIRELLSVILKISPGPELMDIMIDKIQHSNNYDEANHNGSEPFRWIKEGGYVLTSQQRNRIDLAFENNSQVTGSAVMQNLIEYLNSHKE